MYASLYRIPYIFSYTRPLLENNYFAIIIYSRTENLYFG